MCAEICVTGVCSGRPVREEICVTGVCSGRPAREEICVTGVCSPRVVVTPESGAIRVVVVVVVALLAMLSTDGCVIVLTSGFPSAGAMVALTPDVSRGIVRGSLWGPTLAVGVACVSLGGPTLAMA